MTDEEIIAKYRLDRDSILDLLETIAPDLLKPTKRSHAIPPIVRLTTSLLFFATGSFQRECGDLHGVSKSSVSRCIDAVAEAIPRRLRNYVSFPSSDKEVRKVKQGFFNLDWSPNVIGAIDGTLIAIKGLSKDEPLYVCRKGFHAINVQIVCDSELRLLIIVAKWPGSTHDSYIFSQSELAKLLKTMPDRGWLLADSGYPLKPWSLTPVLSPSTRSEQRYNNCHTSTRVVVERFNGVWKSRFRCIDKSGGALQYRPKKCVNVIVYTACLHQICSKRGLPFPAEDVVVGCDGSADVADFGNDYRGEEGADGRQIRQRLIENKFSR